MRQLDNFYRKHHKNRRVTYHFSHWLSLLCRRLQQKQWRLNWTNLFGRSTNQPSFLLYLEFCTFPKHGKHHVTFLARLDANLLGKFCSLLRQFELALLHGIARYCFISFFSALTRSNSRHCSVLFRLLSLALAATATLFCDFLGYFFNFLLLVNFAPDSSLSLSASVKPSHENIILSTPHNNIASRKEKIAIVSSPARATVRPPSPSPRLCTDGRTFARSYGDVITKFTRVDGLPNISKEWMLRSHAFGAQGLRY